MSSPILDMSDLPEEARERLRDHYERLRQQYAEQDEEASTPDPASYRGSI